MKQVETSDGVRLNFVDHGEGRPLVLIHGWPLALWSFEHQLTALPAQGLRCIAYDRRGFGKSSKPWKGYDYDTLADDLAAVLEQLDLRDVTLAGFSMGGGEVVRYFSRHGGRRVSKIVLISATTPFLLKNEDNPDGVDQAVFDEMARMLQTDRPNFLANFSKQLLGGGMLNLSISAAMLDWVRNMALEASPVATLACLRSFSETDFRNEMARITTPALIIHGDADRNVPMAATSAQAARLIPNARFLTYAKAPHGLFLTEKERLNRDLADFVHGRDLRAEMEPDAAERAAGANLSEIGLPTS
jgi:non-heme chloroperoxidase